MESIFCRVSAQCTQNIFAKLDPRGRGYLDQPVLQHALADVTEEEVRTLISALDKEGNARIYPDELNLAILDCLNEPDATLMSKPFTSLVREYGLAE